MRILSAGGRNEWELARRIDDIVRKTREEITEQYWEHTTVTIVPLPVTASEGDHGIIEHWLSVLIVFDLKIRREATT